MGGGGRCNLARDGVTEGSLETRELGVGDVRLMKILTSHEKGRYEEMGRGVLTNERGTGKEKGLSVCGQAVGAVRSMCRDDSQFSDRESIGFGSGKRREREILVGIVAMQEEKDGYQESIQQRKRRHHRNFPTSFPICLRS